MAVPKPDHTPIRGRRGRLVHVLIGGSERPACNRATRSGWVVVCQLVDCPRCLARVRDAEVLG